MECETISSIDDMKRGLAIARNLYSRDLSAFIRRSFSIINPKTPYVHNWHIDAICELLMACYRREIKRLIINVPPRSLKSICSTVAFPAWCLGNNPSLQIMASSYSQKLSFKHSQDTRVIMQDSWYQRIFPHTILAKDQNEKSKFMTTERGQRMAVSVGSTATGEGGDILIMDDPLNPEQAASDVERENANEWFQQTFSSRLNDPSSGVIILVMQRLHEMDVTGMLLEQGGWEHCCFPAINDKKRIISIGNGKNKVWQEGELLHEDRLGVDVLNRKKKEMGSYAFCGQFLQQPSPAGGGILKSEWWKLWQGRTPPKVLEIIQVYDTAYTADKENDYSARTTWGLFDSDGETNIILMEAMNERLEFPDLLQEAKESYRDFIIGTTGQEPLVLVEEKSAGLPLIQELKRSGMRVKGIKRNANSGDKVSRAHNITHILESGRVWVPTNVKIVDGKKHYEPKSYAQMMIDQCSRFPKGEHDDIVDTVVDAISFLRLYKGVKTDYDKEDVSYQFDSDKRKRYY